MTIRADSYGSVANVLAFTRHYLDGQSNFNSTTRPTLTEVEAFIDRASAYMNIALENHGLASPVTNTTAKLAIGDWVVERSAELVEMTQRGTGYSGDEGSRIYVFRNLYKLANEFVKDNLFGLKQLGLSVDSKVSAGLEFTALDTQDDRSDPDDTSLEQPMFSRRRFGYDDPYGAGEED